MPELYSTGVVLGHHRSGLAVGYRLVSPGGVAFAAFTTAGVVETTIPGDYTVTGGVPLPAGFWGRVVWGTAGSDLAEEAFSGTPTTPNPYDTFASLGPSYSGLAAGYRLVDLDGSTAAPFTTAGVAETAVAGDYAVTAGLALPAGFRGRVVWGTAGTDLAEEWVNAAAAVPGVTPAPDPEFMLGMIHRVAAQVDANATGGAKSARGGYTRSWQPVAGQGAFPCFVTPDRDNERPEDQKEGAAVNYVVLSGSPPGWTQYHRLLWVDPDGTSHVLNVQGQSRDESGMAHHWVTKALEIVD